MTSNFDHSNIRRTMKTGGGLAAIALLLSGCSILEVKGGDDDEVAQEQAAGEGGAASKPAPVKASSVKAGETILNAAKTKIGSRVSGAIIKDGPSHFYYFSNPGKLRDKIRIRVENKSTTYRPQINVFDDNRSRILYGWDGTHGASLERVLSLDPGKSIYVEVHPYGSEGAYELSVVALKAYDKYEANDDGMTASTLKFGDTLEASIMDKDDHDWFHVTPATVGKVTVALESLSSTYRPQINVYDANKSRIKYHWDGTHGATLDFNVDVKPGQDFYIEVHPYGSEGKYRLTSRPAVLASDMATALEETGSISLYGVYFDTDKTFVKPSSANTLSQVAALLNADPAIRLEVAGHTDNTGTKAHNMELSQGRADAVVAALVGQHNIDASRLVAKGHGDSKPVAKNSTADGKAKNRRVVLKKL